MVRRPLISVILPNYNHADYLEERLDSILNQTYRNFELIILDDASNDQSLSILGKYKKHKKVSHFIINKKNTGSPFLQWKKGLELVQGEFIWIAESDDSCELNFLEIQLAKLENATISVAKTLAFNSEGTQRETLHPVFKEGKITNLENEQILYCPILNVSAIIFKAFNREELNRSHFSKFQLIGDRVFYFEFFQHKKIVYNPDTTAFFRKEISGLSNLKDKELKYLSRYFNEHTKFIRLAAIKEKGALDDHVNMYLHRFFNRVRNRVPRKEKLSFGYFKLYLYYRKELLKTKFLHT